jgi:hypothetical protein
MLELGECNAPRLHCLRSKVSRTGDLGDQGLIERENSMFNGKFTREEVQVILQLHETRRDQKMRTARDWFATRFFPYWAEDVRDVLLPGQDHCADFTMVASYAEMAASLLIRQVAELELFLGPISDIMLVWVRLKGHAQYVRQTLNVPGFLQNVEQLAGMMPGEMETAQQIDDANRRRQHVKSVQPYLRSAWGKSESEQHDILRDYEAVCLNTLLGMASICNLEAAARHVIAKKLAGAYVECGVWKGGATAYWARSFLRNGGDPAQSSVFCFDSFNGMPHISVQDDDNASKWLHNRSLSEVAGQLTDGALVPTSPTLASEFECRAIVEASGFQKDRIHIVKGWFQDTLPQHKTKIGPIAVLRLDSDFYQATRFCLDILYEHVLPNGMIIIDDYEIYGGCRQAVDEFVQGLNLNINLIYYGEYGCFFFKPC